MFANTIHKSISKKVLLCGILILLANFSFANIYNPKLPDDEDIVTSEGMWKTDIQTVKPTKLTQGASRFDVGGILTAIGLKQGASIFALVVFPILFPLMVLLGLALFVISMFGAGGVAVAGKRSDAVNSVVGLSGGYKQDRYGFPILLTNRDGLPFDADENDTCVERFLCEILLRGGPNLVGKKTTLQLLRGFNVKPIILPNLSLGKKSRKLWKCSSLKCNWDNWIPWSHPATTSGS